MKAIEEKDLIATTKDGKDVTLPCDSVIMSVGYIPTPLAPQAKNVSLVGDCAGIGNLSSVIWKADGVAMAF